MLVVGNDADEATSIIDGAISRTDRNAPEYDGPYSDFNINYYMANMNLSGGISGSPAMGEDGLVLGMVSGGMTDGAICLILPTGPVLQTLHRLRQGQHVPRGDMQCQFTMKPLHECKGLGLDTDWEERFRKRVTTSGGLLVAATLARGMGVIVDAEAGLAAVSRKVVPHKACYLRITFGSSDEAAARCVFLHAHHCYAIIQYDVSSAPSGVDGVTLDERRLPSGSESSLLYFRGPEQLLRGDAVQRSVVLTRPALSPTTPSFRCQPVNADLLEIEVSSEVQHADGVIVGSDGAVQPIWMPGIGGLTAASHVPESEKFSVYASGSRTPQIATSMIES